jgi:hypothetical protein
MKKPYSSALVVPSLELRAEYGKIMIEISQKAYCY